MDATKTAKSGDRPRFRGWWAAVALVSVLIGASLRLLPDRFFGGGVAFITFYPAIAIAALLAGGRAGLLATALSALLADYVLLEPHWTVALRNASDWTALILFLIAGVAISLMAGKLGEARRRERAALEHARLETIRREGETRLAQLADIMPAAIAHCDREGRYRFVNDFYSRRFGLTPAACIGKHISEIVGEEAYASIRRHLEAALRGERVEFETAICYRTVEPRHIRCAFVPELDAEQNVVGAIGVVTDVTEQKRIEAALRESEERFRLMFAASSVGKAEADPATGRFLRVNAALCRITGYSEAELLERTITDITHPDEHALDRERFEKLIRGEMQPNSCEKRYVRPDGAVVWAEVTVNLVRDGEGRPVRSIAVIQDVTARKRAEEALAASRHQLQGIIDNTTALVYALDREGRFVMANAALTGLLNSTPKAMIGKRRHEFMPAADADWHEANDRQVFAAGRPLEFEEYSHLPGRSITWLTTKFPLRDAQGEIYAVAGISADISERKRAEAILYKNERRQGYLIKLSEALRRVGDALDVQENAARVLAEELGVERAAYFEVRGNEYVVERDYAKGVPSLRGGFAIESFGPRLRAAYEAGKPVVAADVAADADLSAADRASFAAIQIGAYVGMPLIKDGRFVAGLAVHSRLPRAWTAEEVELLAQTAELTWAAVERARAETALRREKERLLALVNSIPDEIWAGDAEGNLELVNPAVVTEFGQGFIEGNVEAVAVRSEALRADGSRRPVEEAPLLRALKGEIVKGEEELLRSPRGDLRHRQVNASPFRNAAGEIIGAVAVVRDITEQKRAEKALRASEDRLRQAADLVGLCTFTWKPQTGDLTWDPGIKPMWGLPPDAPINYEVWRAGIHPQDLPMVEERVARSLDPGGDGLYEAEYRVNGADGVQRWISTRGHTEFEDGRPSVHLGVVVEITARKRTEEALRESEERFRALADGTPVLVWVHGADGGLRFVNRAWREFFGVTLEQATGGKWKPLLHPEDMQAYVEGFLKCHAERREFAAQARVRRHDGEWRWVESTGVPRFSGTGEFLGMAGSSVDVTERKRAEAVLARDKEELERLVGDRTAKLQELVNELEHFSYTITHDMRAPLRAMRGLAEIMTETEGALSKQERSKFTRRIITAAERMDGLITDALLYSRLVRQELPMGPIDLEKLLRGMLETYPEFQRENADFEIGPLPGVMGNEAGLTQCFSNLLGNAVKFAKPGEKPVVRVRSENVADIARPDWVRLWVEDNGVGISEAMKPRVFDMFSRGAHPRAGTGIGLALVRKVVDRMGGRVGVESEEGRGSRFWVELKRGDVRARGSDPLTTGTGREKL